MPFTASHAAAVLPFGSRLSASALVIGAMVPDVPLYVPVEYGQTHSALAMVTSNLLVGLILFVVWHGFLARPADWFAPTAIRARLTQVQQPGLRRRLNSPRKVAVVIASLLIGQATHLFLDLFTHSGTMITSGANVFTDELLGVPVYYVLQVGLSVVGLALLAGWAGHWFRTAEVRPVQRQSSPLGQAAALGTIATGAGTALVLTASAMSEASLRSALFQMTVTTIGAAVLATFAVAAWWHVRRVMD